MSIQTPFISVIIPTYRRRTSLHACLEALTRLDYPRTCFEVILVDDGGGTPLTSVVEPFECRLPLKWIEQSHAGAAAARNRGAMEAQGEVLAFTDDDCRPAPDWLATIAGRWAADRNGGVAGRTVNALVHSAYAAASQALVDVLRDHALTHSTTPPFFPSSNLALPAEGFRRIGGFCPKFALTAEDRDLCERWRASGGSWTYAPEAVIYHAHDLTLQSFWRQQFTHGRSAYHFHQTRAGQYQPDLTLYLAVVRHPLSTHASTPDSAASGLRVLQLAALLALSQLAVASGFLRERFSR
jgi:GT2 family glycosyltransferase